MAFTSAIPLLACALAAGSLDRAVTLARQHQFREAAAEVADAPVPSEPFQLLGYHRLKAAIASGLGDAATAASEMDAALLLAPEDKGLQAAAAVAALQEGQALAEAKKYSEAAPFFDRAFALAPERGEAAFNAALAWFEAGDWDRAATIADRAKAAGDSATVESLIGDIAEKRGDPLAAVRAYQAAVTLNPGEERYRAVLAVELLHHQTFPAAVAVLEQAARLFPASAKLRVLLGLSYFLVDRSQDSIDALLEALRAAPEDEAAKRYLAEITFLDTASPDPRAVDAVCKDPHQDAFCGAIRLRTAKESGDQRGLSEIVSRLKSSAREKPREALAHCQLGKAYEWQNRWEQARTEMETCVALEPNTAEGHYRLARVYRQLGLHTKAAEQNRLQEQAVVRESEASVRRAEAVQKFLFELH